MRREAVVSKADELSKMFSEHNAPKKDMEEPRRFALALMMDADGEYALIKVSEGGDLKLLGWMKDRECAEELARLINLIGNGGVECSFGNSSDIEEALLNGIRQQGLH